jgi:hypothetical protein
LIWRLVLIVADLLSICRSNYWDMAFWIADPLAVDQRSKTRCARDFLRLCASLESFSKTLEGHVLPVVSVVAGKIVPAANMQLLK